MRPGNLFIKNNGPEKNLYFNGEDGSANLLGTFQAYSDDRVKVVDEITEIEPGLFAWQREFRCFRRLKRLA